MYTECPSCKTFFKIGPSQLKAAGGKVRCGNCDEVFSALDGLVDIVPDDAVAQAEAAAAPVEKENTNTSVVASEIDLQTKLENSEAASLEDEQNTSLSSAEKSELALEDDAPLSSLSIAELEAPTSTEAEVASALESSAEQESSEGTNKSKPTTKQNAIIDDIDAALDGLFDGETEMPDAAGAVSDTASVPIESISELSAISEMGELNDMDFGSPTAAKTKKTETTSADSLLNSLPDVEESELTLARSKAATSLADDMSSLSAFERELEAVSAVAPVESETLDESSFDLGDSFLDTSINDDAKPADNRSQGQTKKIDEDEETDKRAGDSYILEEIEGKKKSKPSGLLSKTLWIVVILVLLVVLLGQFAYLKRQDLAKYPEAKQIIEGMCEKLNAFYPCDITPAKDVSAIELLERNVVSHPNAENALLITSTIENKAEFDQAFPELVLTFSDINQKIIAKRKFTPTEYLSEDVDIDAGMKKQVPVKIMLEIVDPGEEAVNFEFNFE